MSRLSMRQQISRRSAVRIGALLAYFSLVSGPSSREAEAAIWTTWDFPGNKGLDAGAVAERFDLINRSYDIGQAFSDEDIDFVLRYARYPLLGELGFQDQFSSEYENKANLYKLNVSMSEKYVGNFSYRCDAIVQAGCSDNVCQSISVWEKRTVYGWNYPFDGESFGIVDRFNHEQSQEAENWFTAEFVDEFTGIAVCSYLQYGSFIISANGNAISLESSPDHDAA